jgi:hypothetical protein
LKVLFYPNQGEEAMKKWTVLFGVFVILVLVFAINCKSPASSEAASPFMAADSGSGSSSSSNTGSGGGSSGDTTTTLGSLTIMLKDKPVADADQVLVTISSISVHNADTDEFVEIPFASREYDLYRLKDNPAILKVATLEPGNYNQVRVEVTDGRIVFLEDTGELEPVEMSYDMKIPSGKIKIPVHFSIQEGGMTHILLDFDAGESIKVTKRGNKDSYILRPVIKVVDVIYPEDV